MANLSKDQIDELKNKLYITHVIPSDLLKDKYTVSDLKIKKLITRVDSSDSIETDITHTIAVESLKLSSYTVGLLFGVDGDENEYCDTVDLYIRPTPENADIESVEWSNSDPTIVSMTDFNGGVLITPIKLGHVTITATVNGDKTASCSISVIAPDILVKGLTLDKNNAEVNTSESDQTITLKATITPENATHPGVLWSSTDENITFTEVTPYDSSEVVVHIPQGVSGTIVVTAKSINVSSITDTCTITANNQ